MELFTKIKRSQYSILQDKDSFSPSRGWSWSVCAGQLRPSKSVWITIFILLISTVSGISGYLAGKHFGSEESNSLIQLNKIPVTFEYEFNFAEAPSNLTSQRWESLFPQNGGFFKHPDVGPDPVGFAVFHQLHCLDGLRNAYWSMRDGNHSEEGHSHHSEHSSEHSADAHVRHCLEYIRQSLICAADTTIELTVKAPEEGRVGVRGFGTQHVCRDFRQLVDWTSKWE